MARRKVRATALSISLPQELAAAIDARVQSGLYGSASELIREALRRFFLAPTGSWTPEQVAEPDRDWRGGPVAAGTPSPAPPVDEAARDRRRRLERALDELETDDVIRLAPDRLQRLRDAHATRPPR